MLICIISTRFRFKEAFHRLGTQEGCLSFMQQINLDTLEILSHPILIQRYLDWDRVEKRLNKFPHIQNHFPKDVLEKGVDTPPYYCHYMAWRLGTWPNGCENLFKFFDKLLDIASGLKNWESEFRSFKSNCEFAEFWSLLWQLQVAQFFLQSGEVSWNSQGPDISVRTKHGTFYVECYTYRKSFGMENFIEELMRKIDGNIRVEHQPNLPFTLPSDSNRDQFLDELFRPYLSPKYLENKREEARQSWPVDLHVPASARNFRVYLEGSSDAYAPGLNASGDPRKHLEDAISKGINHKSNNKKISNSLDKYRPNILAINYLLSPDFQMSCSALEVTDEKLPAIDFGKSLDAVLLAACGIDCELSSKEPLSIFTHYSKEDFQSQFPIRGVNFVEKS